MKDKDKWPALLRGNILSAAVQKHINYISIADRRAQSIITVTAFLIPIALAGILQPQFFYGAILSILTSLASMILAILSLIPKRYVTEEEKENHLLHFSGIARFSEDAYVAKLGASMNDPSRIGELVARDLYHLSKNVLMPKFKLIQYSYGTFILGNILALVVILLA